jgi:two-component system phosphate regulon response regulator PhoB/two-component system alkaline phosphatase synthesis response regulator PhoP
MKRKILIIEDDKFFRDLISKKLREGNFDVATASDGKEALAYLQVNIPDIIILDLILPGLDGYEILSILKKDKKTSGIPVLILSNLGQREEIERARALGATDFMVKVNFTLEEILAKINQIFKEKFI